MKIKANNANAPMWKDVYTHSNLPKQLEPLKEMSTNLWWVWNHEGAKLFGKVDPALWKSTEGNPVQLLQSLSYKRMEEILADEVLMSEINKVYGDFKNYMSVLKLFDANTREINWLLSNLETRNNYIATLEQVDLNISRLVENEKYKLESKKYKEVF